ncbi:MAG: N-acetyltransferase [Actinomycetes bacterium]|nr:N-acetyltransferase [Actinomycetes bacterium]MDX5398987.1 N-acetyltransferase [Actinomycetes bacterium]
METPADAIEITRNGAASRFEIRLDGELVGIAEHFDDGEFRAFVHTEVDPSHTGKGLAGKLIGHALRETRADGLKVDPVCPYVAAFIRRHPQYRDLLA